MLLSFLACQLGVCNEVPPPAPYEEDEIFNRGKMVEKESDEYQRALRREKQKNWTLALTTTALGIATFILVAKERH